MLAWCAYVYNLLSKADRGHDVISRELSLVEPTCFGNFSAFLTAG